MNENFDTKVSSVNEHNMDEGKIRKVEVDGLGRAYATGKRKQYAVARVWIKEGTGKFVINGCEAGDLGLFRGNPYAMSIVNKPFVVIGQLGKIDVNCTVKGGGCNGQLDAIKYGIAGALIKLNPVFHKAMRAAGLLTRDSRIVESKKHGRLKSRKKPQFSKR